MVDELITLIHVENFNVIALNETWLDTKKQASSCRSRHTWLQGFSCGQPMYVKNKMNPMERKSSAACTRKII